MRNYKKGAFGVYPYGLIGNCQISALISDRGSIDWLCLPRPDSPPVFGKLLDPQGGEFSIELADLESKTQSYLANTNILMTDLRSKDGSAIRITDFCPRFLQHARTYRPISLFRIVERIHGSPKIQVKCSPVSGWDKNLISPIRGNSHLRWNLGGSELRLTTNMSLTYLEQETGFLLTDPLSFALTWGVGVEDDIQKVSLQFLDQTTEYWRTWVKHCSIPSLYQKETIRSALALKLHCYEDTGAILAALTTSLPEEDQAGRNWDYRFCWLRDAYYVLSAFRNLGHFEEMEGFLKFLLGIAHHHEHSSDRLRPVYALDQTLPLPEIENTNWAGFRDNRPVRSFNQAAEHVQNDVYGEMILTLAPIFLDERFQHLRTEAHEGLIAHLATYCVQSISKADAGLWEVRNGWQEHSFTNLMCWAGLDRTIKMQEAGFLKGATEDFKSARARAQIAVEKAISDGVLRNGPLDPSFDASLLQLPKLKFPGSDLSLATVARIADELGTQNGPLSSFVYRYKRSDDFGSPKSAFLVCSFWLAQAYASLGKIPEAKRVMDEVVQKAANPVGLFSEHFSPHTGMQFGNFPQAYSHVGLINAAFAVSPQWDEVF